MEKSKDRIDEAIIRHVEYLEKIFREKGYSVLNDRVYFWTFYDETDKRFPDSYGKNKIMPYSLSEGRIYSKDTHSYIKSNPEYRFLYMSISLFDIEDLELEYIGEGVYRILCRSSFTIRREKGIGIWRRR